MGLEIERRFLVDAALVGSALPSEGASFRQGYLCIRPTVRVRLARCQDAELAWLTIKGPGKRVRSEFEVPIPPSDARELLELCVAELVKTRYEVQHAGHLWEVDRFGGKLEGLWLAEVELEDVDEPVVIPSWVLREVTADGRYSNAALAQAAGPPGCSSP